MSMVQTSFHPLMTLTHIPKGLVVPDLTEEQASPVELSWVQRGPNLDPDNVVTGDRTEVFPPSIIFLT